MIDKFSPKVRGNYCQQSYGEQIRFVEVNVYHYCAEEVERYKVAGILGETLIGKCLKMLPSIPSKDQNIFQVSSYFANPNTDAWIFNDSISEYEERAFLEGMEVLLYCRDSWGVAAEDFVPIEETEIP